MNIFILHQDPIQAAHYHCDQHLNKMILESAQMLSTAIHIIAPHKIDGMDTIYKAAYLNHPCTVWVRQSYDNFLYCLDLAYTLQSLLPRLHASTSILHNCEKLAKQLIQYFPMSGLTPFALAMPDEIKYCTKYPDAISKYHEWYKYKALEWRIAGKYMSYTNRPTPEFIASTLRSL